MTTDDRTLAAYQNCRRYLKVDLARFDAACQRRQIAFADLVAACAAANSRYQLIAYLKNTGLSLQDIADVLGVSRQCVHQMAQKRVEYTGERCHSIYKELDLPALRLEVLNLLLADPTLYNCHGNILWQTIVGVLNTAHPEVSLTLLREALVELDIRLVDVAFYHLKIADEERFAWIKKQYARGLNSKEILAILNRGLPHPVSEMNWSRYVRSLGIRPGYGIPVL